MPASDMLFRQLFDSTSSTFTYILADLPTREAVIIDPVIEQVDRDLGLLSELHLNLKYAINTHCHADHITDTGRIKLRPLQQQLEQAATAVLALQEKWPGVRTGISRASGAKADIRYDPGDYIHLGCPQLRVLPTPGHTSGCIAYHSEADGSRVFTGRTVSTIAEEKQHNLRLTKSRSDFVDLMANLGLPYPKKIDEAGPANMVCGINFE